jgi:RNA polymerase sigma-70 factor, ECF subfamily
MTNGLPLASQGLLDALTWAARAPAARQAESDDASLAALAKRDREAFAELYRRHANSVYRYMLAYVGNPQDAQDLTAQTFLAGLENIASFAGRGTFAAWLFGIARRKAMDYFRQDPHTVPLDALAELAHPSLPPDQMVEDTQDYEQLAAAIRSLAPDRAEALTLRVFAELPICEIAAAMGRRESAVRMLLSRAVHDLKHMLNDPAQNGAR